MHKQEIEISERYKFLANIIKHNIRIYREFILTIFSMNPIQNYFNEIKELAGHDHTPAQSTGSYYLVFGFDFVKCNDYDPFNVPSDILDDPELLKDTCFDLIILCGHMRNKTLSWCLPTDALFNNCQNLMTEQTRNF